jgi:RNA-directed DNA polymerase
MKVAIMLEKVQKDQMELVKLAEMFGIKSSEVYRRQTILARSLTFRLVAVSKLINNSGSIIPGVDGRIITTKTTLEEKAALVESLLTSLNPKYKAKPVRRVLIPKGKSEMKSLSILTIQDRALQNLINMILLPLVEMNSDTHNYGCRPYRSAKNAIGILRQNLRTSHETKWILDIKGFYFENINHE